jgi:hypothetical protein
MPRATELTDALRSPVAMDGYLEVTTAKEIIADINRAMQAVRETPPTEVRSDDEALADLVSYCGSVPYLATCIYETITRAGLKLVKI